MALFRQAAWPILIIALLLTVGLATRLVIVAPDFRTDVTEFAPDDDALAGARDRMEADYGAERVTVSIHVAPDDRGNALGWARIQQQHRDLAAIETWSASRGNGVLVSSMSVPDLLQLALDEEANGTALADVADWGELLDLTVDNATRCNADIDDELADVAAFVRAALLSEDLDIAATCDWLDGDRSGPAPEPTASAALWIIDLDPSLDTTYQQRTQAELRDLLDDLGGDLLSYQAASLELVSHDLDDRTGSDLLWLIIVSGIAVLIVLSIAFRTLSGPIYPMVGLTVTLVWTYGGLSIGVAHFTALEVAIAPLILGLGIDYSIHLQRRYIHHRSLGEDAAEAWVSSLEKLLVPLSLAVITTVAAFLASLVSDLPPLRVFGVGSALGVLSAFITSTLVVGALHVVLDGRVARTWKPRGFDQEAAWIRRAATNLRDAQQAHRVWAILIVALLTAGSFAAVTQIDREFDLTDFLADDVPVMVARAHIQDDIEASGWKLVYLMIEAPEGQDVVRDDATLVDAMQQLDDQLHLMRSVVRPTLGSDALGHAAYDGIIPLLRQAIERDAVFGDRHCLGVDGDSLVTQSCYSEGDLAGALGDLSTNTSVGDALRGRTWAQRVDDSAVLDQQGRIVSLRVEILVHAVTSDDSSRAVREIHDLVDRYDVYGDRFVLTPTSQLLELELVLNGLITSQLESTGLSLLVAFLVLWALTGRRVPDVALLVVLPVAIAATWVIGMMALLGLNWNVMTVMVTALTIGIGIDYSIHVWRRFDRLLQNEGKGPWEAVLEMYDTTGAALVLSGVTTMTGFLVLLISPMPIISDFGKITALTVLSSLVLALVLLPVLLAENALRGSENGNGGGPAADDSSAADADAA